MVNLRLCKVVRRTYFLRPQDFLIPVKEIKTQTVLQKPWDGETQAVWLLHTPLSILSFLQLNINIIVLSVKILVTNHYPTL